MEIHPIQSFKAMPTKKKVAVVAGTAVAAGAIATTAVAYSKGKKAGVEGFGAKIKEGYKQIGDAIKTQWQKLTKKGEQPAPDKAQPTPPEGPAPAPAPSVDVPPQA